MNTTTVYLGNLPFDLTQSGSVSQLISNTMQYIHYFALVISLCLILLAIVRQYAQFGEHMGLRFIGSLFVVFVLIFCFPKICDNVSSATESYSQGVSNTMEGMFIYLISQKPDAGKGASEELSLMQKIARLPENIMHSIQAALCNIFYVNGIIVGKAIRDMVYFIFKCLYNGALCLTPIFFAGLLIPETKHLGVNFIVTTVGFALMPLCFLFGDLCNIWLAEHMWSALGLGHNGTFWTMARPGQALAFPIGSLLAYIGFGILYALIAALVYIILPFLYMKLFRTGSPSSPVGLIAAAIGKAINTAVVAGAIVATGGTAAPAAASGSGSSTASGASSAAANAAKGTASSGKGREKESASSKIDEAANA